MNKRNATIIGTGSYVPEHIMPNKEFEKVGSSDEWIYSHLGIRERRIAAKDQVTSDMATVAAKRAIEDAKLQPNDIDLIVLGTITPDRISPSTASVVYRKLGMTNSAPAFDINVACSGFVYGMTIASQFIETGMYNNVLVVGGETFSKMNDWESRDSVFWGDGAGAVVLSYTGGDYGFINHKIYANGDGTDNVTIPAGGSEFPATEQTVRDKKHVIYMEGKPVYQAAIQVAPAGIKAALKDAGLTPDDIDIVIPHQPSKNMLKKIFEIAGIPWEKVETNMDKYANTSGGTVGIMLDEANKAGKLKKGDTVLFVAIGAGWTWAASILKWGCDR